MLKQRQEAFNSLDGAARVWGRGGFMSPQRKTLLAALGERAWGRDNVGKLFL